jgi:hypothetical protein
MKMTEWEDAIRRDKDLSIVLGETNGVSSLTFWRVFFPGDLASIVDAFIESFPYHEVSGVECRVDETRYCQTVNMVNVRADVPFQFEDGSWFVCSEHPLELTFEEHNELMGCDARIPGGFSRMASKVLHSTKATCFGIMDVDSSHLTVCFWPVEQEVIESHLEPILHEHGLRICSSAEAAEKMSKQTEEMKAKKAARGIKIAYVTGIIAAVLSLISAVVSFASGGRLAFGGELEIPLNAGYHLMNAVLVAALSYGVGKRILGCAFLLAANGVGRIVYAVAITGEFAVVIIPAIFVLLYIHGIRGILTIRGLEKRAKENTL